MSYYNPFQSLELKVPEVYREQVESYSQTRPGGGSKPSPDDSPFERQIDLWFLAVCIGAQTAPKSKRHETKKSHKFIMGDVLSKDSYRIELLELIAISITKDPWIIEKPSEIMDLANDLAATGLPKIIEMLKDGNAKPLWNLTDHIIDMLPSNKSTS